MAQFDKLVLNNNIRESLLQQKAGHAALVLDLLFSSGVSVGVMLSVRDIMSIARENGVEISEYVIRSGLTQAKELGLMAWRRVINRKKGRPTILYGLATIKGIAEKLGVKWWESADSIGKVALSSLRNYRAALHRALIERRPGRYARGWLGERLGVGKRATWNYEQATDIEVTAQFEREEILIEDVVKLPTRVQKWQFFMLSEYSVVLTDEEIDVRYFWRSDQAREDLKNAFERPTKWVEKRLPLCQFLANRELSKGRRIYKCWQTTNEYHIFGRKWEDYAET